MASIDDASSLQQLGDLAFELASVSMKQYQQLTTQVAELLAGGRSMDSEQLAKSYTTYVGTVVRDLGNAMTILQKAVQLATPAPPEGRA